MASDEAWQELKRPLVLGSHVRCRVKEHRPFGVFTTIDDLPFDGLIEIIQFKDSGRMTPADYPAVGSEVEAVVLGFADRNKQIHLGVKASQLAKAGPEIR